MKISILGSGGVFPIPRPCCPCAICINARSKAMETWQTGPSMFVHGANILFDTPEEIRFQLLRSKIDSVEHVLLTHWHPDHTQGLRVIEQITRRRPEIMPVCVHMAKTQFEMLCTYGSGNILKYYAEQGIVQMRWFEADTPIHFNEIEITPIFIERTKGYYFLVTDKNNKKLVYAPCEYHGLTVPEFVSDIDTFIAHCLWFEDNRIGHEICFSDSEDSFETMLSHAQQMNAKHVYITHIEESFGSTVDELNRMAEVCYPQFDIHFAIDGTVIEI
jgi:phosphoribosyl 1,2-cyclic phosphate phosphodiesterase